MPQTTTNRRANARTLGLVVACALTLIFAGLIGILALRAGKGSRPQPLPDELTDVPVDPHGRMPRGAGGIASGVSSGKGFSLTSTDRNDPTRAESELTAEHFEPLAAERYRLDQPRAWWFLRDGRTVFLRADKGQAYIPGAGAGSRPEDGTLDGNVIIMLFSRLPGNARPNPERDAPELVIRTPRLAFDGTLGQLDLPQEVAAQSTSGRFSGRGVRVLFNEVDQRVEQVTVEQTDFVYVNAGAGLGLDSKPQPRPTASAAGPAAVPAAPAQPVPTPAELTTQTLYHAVAQGSPVVTQGARRIAGESLEAFVRFVDNALPTGAVSDPGPHVPPLPIPGQVLASVLALPSDSAEPPAAAGVFTTANDEPVLLRWSGPLTIRAIPAAGELARDNVFVRVSSPTPGGVRFSDAASQSDGVASVVSYGATTRELTMSDPAGAVIGSRDAGGLTAQKLEVSLAEGRVHVPGAGVLAATEDRPDHPRQVHWNGEATFEFETRNGQMTSRLTSARLVGKTGALEHGAGLLAESILAEFTDLDGQPTPTRLQGIGAVHAFDDSGGTLDADTLDVGFFGGAAVKPLPATIVARGNARARRDNIHVTASSLVGRFGMSRPDHSDLVEIVADGPVEYRGEDGTLAQAPLLIADPIMQTARLLGPGSRIVRAGSCIDAVQIDLDGLAKSASVTGAGAFEHQPPATDEAAPVATALWTSGMSYDDRTGRVTCDGNTRLEWSRGEFARDSLRARSIEITMDGVPQGAPIAASPALDVGSSRRVLSVHARGETPGEPARIESRRYAPDVRPARLEQLLYLEGVEIIADNARGALDVPGAGKLLTVDRRQAAQAERTGIDPTSVSNRGTALFTWTGAMNLDRAAGLITMRDNVRLTHDSIDAKRTELGCDRLEAVIREQANGSAPRPDTSFAGELISATAAGGVRLASEGRQMSCDSLRYDALQRIADAESTSGRVTVVDASRATPVSARRIIWDLQSGRLDLRDTSSVVVPR